MELTFLIVGLIVFIAWVRLRETEPPSPVERRTHKRISDWEDKLHDDRRLT